MSTRQCIDVRADYYKNGEVVPIAYIDNGGKTNYIRKINNIENRISEFGKFERRYLCNSSQKDVLLVLFNELWYLEE